MILQSGAITVAKNERGPLDLAKADPMTENKSTILHRRGTWGRSLYTYMIAIPDSDIASVIAYRGWQGAKAFMLAISDLRYGERYNMNHWMRG